ncbi:MAG: hypothetical protein IKO82_04260 [Prevotella sp.]|nr:hypothetical protein [Prevotella sp.]
MKTLRDSVRSEVAIPLYKANTFEVDATQVKRLANVYAPEGLAQKLSEVWEDDFQSAIAIYEAYQSISPLLASNEAFWAYLTHVDLFAYTQKRWPKVKDNDCTADYIIDHWFVGSNGLLRNAVASMWWSVYNTIDEERENKYELTEVLFKNYTLRVITFGSYQLIRHREAMIGVLSFLKDNPEVMTNAFEYRGRFISKYFNRLGAVKQLAYLKRDFFYDVCAEMKDKIMSITKLEQISDESLYNDIV